MKLNATLLCGPGSPRDGPPGTCNDLAAQMRRNVHYFFPRAERNHAEPKRLVEMGLATAGGRGDRRSGRGRSTPSRTPGDELRPWLSDEPVRRG